MWMLRRMARRRPRRSSAWIWTSWRTRLKSWQTRSRPCCRGAASLPELRRHRRRCHHKPGPQCPITGAKCRRMGPVAQPLPWAQHRGACFPRTRRSMWRRRLPSTRSPPPGRHPAQRQRHMERPPRARSPAPVQRRRARVSWRRHGSTVGRAGLPSSRALWNCTGAAPTRRRHTWITTPPRRFSAAWPLWMRSLAKRRLSPSSRGVSSLHAVGSLGTMCRRSATSTRRALCPSPVSPVPYWQSATLPTTRP
mmetsp:Transcript_2596/g.5655  ORF Transcript_2596/g.5655 Transcript_2596/m.5655 type:complete len:251 (+) Transcript_2596:1179-1931(+)